MLYRKGMRMDGKPEISLLYDFYKELLNTSQQQVVELYVNDDLSLAEVADILSISRQGVRDSLNRAIKKMRDCENRLHLLADYRTRVTVTTKIMEDVEKIRGLTDDPGIVSLCDRITDNINCTIRFMEKEDRHGV